MGMGYGILGILMNGNRSNMGNFCVHKNEVTVILGFGEEAYSI